MSVLIAVDGGASKTDLALLSGDGELLALARGPLSSPHYLGLDGSLNVLEKLLDQASDEARLARGNGPVADLAELLMAGVDFRLSRVFGLGPFVGFSLGQYSRAHVEVNNTSQDNDIPETAMHQWLTVGLRTVFFP